ncbi:MULTISPECIES: DUF6086 family protein [Streptomyces]|uniref:Uncharacterized protein n=1 Tax=Streptomyces luteosporeus TaxID=173856 RepID=A0ABN3TLL7_9ACTN
MSQLFEMDGEILWYPSNGPARLFLRQVSVFEAEAGRPSGIGPMVNDECRIDPAAFRPFANALLAWYRTTTHPVMTAMAEGFIGTVLVLAERAGMELEWRTPARPPKSLSPADAATAVKLAEALDRRVDDLRHASRELGRSMTR